MGTPITTLVSGIETKAGLFLGSDFSKISYGIDLAKNRSGGSKKSFAVLPQEANQDDSIGALVVNQSFRFRLTDSYNPGKLNDHNSQTITNSLYDKVYELFEYLVTEKCGSPSLVMTTYGLSVVTPEYLEDEIVVIEFTFTIKHRLT